MSVVYDAGALAGASGTSDVVDAHVVIVAAEAGAGVVTSDERDLTRLTAHLPSPVHVMRL